jgi:putative transposase
MMLDANIVATSPSSVWRVLGQAALLSKWNGKRSKKGTGFEQPLAAHQHWHIDVSYINISGTFYTCAAFWRAAADTSSTGISGSR